MRLFVALMLGAVERRALAGAVEASLGPRLGDWRRPAADGLHLTLVFLGATEEARVDALSRALGAELAGRAAPRLVLGGTGAFPRWRGARVLWIGAHEEPGTEGRLAGLHERALAAVGEAGCQVVQEDWRPHVTVARWGRRAHGAQVAGAARVAEAAREGVRDVQTPTAAFKELELAIAWRPDEVALVESRPTSREGRVGAPRYVPLLRIQLA